NVLPPLGRCVEVGSGKSLATKAWSQVKQRAMSCSIAAGWRHSAGLTDAGTVVAVGENNYGQCDVGHWRDIVAVAAGSAHTGSSHTVGLRADGTVVATGWNK